MKLGKLTTDELKTCVLDLLSVKRKEVLMSAALGEDCAALATDDIILVSSDPITAVVEYEKLGALCVSVCCNDVSANGGEPIAMMLTVIMPPSCSADDVKTIMLGASERATELGVDIVGGHTEFSDCVVRPIVCGTAIGKTQRVLKKSAIKPSDKLLVTKSLALEGTCLICDALKPTLSEEENQKIATFNEMLSVTNESKVLRDLEQVSSMHDVTEGGILGAVAEICYSAGVGAKIYKDAMPVDELTLKLCKVASVDPLRLISSGCMLITASEVEPIKTVLAKIGVPVCEIGEITSTKEVLLISDDGEEKIDILPDEMYKFSGEKQL